MLVSSFCVRQYRHNFSMSLALSFMILSCSIVLCHIYTSSCMDSNLILGSFHNIIKNPGTLSLSHLLSFRTVCLLASSLKRSQYPVTAPHLRLFTVLDYSTQHLSPAKCKASPRSPSFHPGPSHSSCNKAAGTLLYK